MSRDDWAALPCCAMGLSVVCDCSISWSYLLFLHREVLTTVPTTEVALYRAVMTTVPTTEAVLYRAVMATVPTMEVALYRAVIATVPYREVVLYTAVLTTVPQREVALYKAVMATVPTTEVVLFRAVMPSNYLLETSNNWFFLFSRWKRIFFFNQKPSSEVRSSCKLDPCHVFLRNASKIAQKRFVQVYSISWWHYCTSVLLKFERNIF